MNPPSASRALNLIEQEMARDMCLELTPPDFKAIGGSRGLAPETIASRELLQHVFLSEQGVAPALASLDPEEIAGLHLLHSLHDNVDLEFFKRIYPSAVSADQYSSYNDRFKHLFQQVKTQLIRRGLLLCDVAQDRYPHRTILERRRFRLPEAFGALLPAPFLARQLDPSVSGKHRREVLRDKLKEILQSGESPASKPARSETGRWRLENGRLLLGAKDTPFRMEQLMAWQRAQFAAAVGYASKVQPEAFWPVPLLVYALSRLREGEWLAANELLPLWKMALGSVKVPEPRRVCEVGHEWGCVEKIEHEGGVLYRLPHYADSESDTPPESWVQADHPQSIGIRLERVPLAALERLGGISQLELAEGRLRAAPDLLKLSHASADTLADPMLGWLREHHPAFRATMEKIAQRRGKVIVHQNLLVARIRDLSLKVMLEKKFGAPGQLVALDREFVAFPSGLLPEFQAWMKKSGHVIKSIASREPDGDEKEKRDDE